MNPAPTGAAEVEPADNPLRDGDRIHVGAWTTITAAPGSPVRAI